MKKKVNEVKLSYTKLQYTEKLIETNKKNILMKWRKKIYLNVLPILILETNSGKFCVDIFI